MTTKKAAKRDAAAILTELFAAVAGGELEARADTTGLAAADQALAEAANRALDALAGKAHMYRACLDAIPFPISVTDMEMNWLFFNDAAVKVTGLDRDAMAGKPCCNWGADICKTSRCGIEKLRAGETTSFFTQPGLDMDFQVDVQHIHDVDGAEIGHIEVVQDITASTRIRDYQADAVERVTRCLSQFARGDLDLDTSVAEADSHTAEVRERFLEISASLDRSVEAVRTLVGDTRRLVDAGAEGRLDVRADATRHAGDFRVVVEGFNQTLDVMLGPIKQATQALEALADRDLTTRIDAEFAGDHGKIKEALNNTAASLDQSIGDVSGVVEQVASAADQIARSSEQLASGASQQASALQQTAASMQQIAAQTDANASNTRAAKDLADQAKATTDTGLGEIQHMVEAMAEIKTAAEQTAVIIRDINDIAFQTNLLALNAAVEAARAGEAGRGFAVVAEEVRNLAGRAKEAARNTEHLIKQSVNHVEKGQTISSSARANLDKIAELVGKVTGLVGEITLASGEQARGISQVNVAISEMDNVVQQTAAGSEESSSAALQLSSQARQLAQQVASFQLSAAGGPPARSNGRALSAAPRANARLASRRDEDFLDF
jgi:methyl-accepting chemotaxis protein